MYKWAIRDFVQWLSVDQGIQEEILGTCQARVETELEK